MKVGDNVVVVEENWVHLFKKGQKGIVEGLTQDGIFVVKCPELNVIQLMREGELEVDIE